MPPASLPIPYRCCTALAWPAAQLPPCDSAWPVQAGSLRLLSLPVRRQLVIANRLICPDSLEAFRWLPGLTALHLPDCELGGLPDGPYLSSLRR